MSSYPPPVPGEQKKGLSGWAVAGIGCLVILVLGFVGAGFAAKWLWGKGKEAMEKAGVSMEDFQSSPEKAAAKIFVAANPDIELVSEDAGGGTMTVKVKSSGETLTVSYADLAKGKLVMTSSSGEQVTIDGTNQDGQGKIVMKSGDSTTVIGTESDLVPTPAWVPVFPKSRPMSGGVRSENSEGVKGTTLAEADATVTEVKDFYESELKAKGYEVQTTVTNAAGADSAMLSADSADKKSKLVIMINSEGQKVNVMLNYEGPK